jgi:hypothetical protein
MEKERQTTETYQNLNISTKVKISMKSYRNGIWTSFYAMILVIKTILYVRDGSGWCLHMISFVLYYIYVKRKMSVAIYKTSELDLWLGRKLYEVILHSKPKKYFNSLDF